jgi:hypothetical protein
VVVHLGGCFSVVFIQHLLFLEQIFLRAHWFVSSGGAGLYVLLVCPFFFLFFAQNFLLNVISLALKKCVKIFFKTIFVWL